MGSKQTKLDNRPATTSVPVTSQDISIQNSTTSPQQDGVQSVQCLDHTSVPMSDPAPEPLADPHPEEDVSMFTAHHPEHIPLHVFTGPTVGAGQKNSAALAAAVALGEEEEVFVDFCVKLMPHQHTLFCERRERVCGAVGKIQEGEELEVDGLLDTTGGYWIRSLPMDKHSAYSFIPGTENSSHYTLTAADDGRYIAFQYAQLLQQKGSKGHKKSPVGVCTSSIKMTDTTSSNNSSSNNTHNNDHDHDHTTQQDMTTPSHIPSGPGSTLPLMTTSGDLFETKRTINSLGPVLPGPPRMLDLRVDGKTEFWTGDQAVVRAEGQYIGGREGLSEYWWFKIMKGKRIQLSEPLSVSSSVMTREGDMKPGEEQLQDPRMYVLREEDVGCVLKVKCRPIRSDGHKGEIFTSKASGVITSRPQQHSPSSEL